MSSRTAFPNAVEAYERAPGLWTAYYDGRVGGTDVLDAQKYKGSQIFARRLSSSFGRDLVLAGANVTVILEDPSEAEAFRWACDGVSVAAVLRRDISWGLIDDLKRVGSRAAKKAGPGKRVGSVKIFAFESEASGGGAADINLVRGSVLPRNYDPEPGTLSYYVLRGK